MICLIINKGLLIIQLSLYFFLLFILYFAKVGKKVFKNLWSELRHKKKIPVG